jgi:uncharacterized paraquat-inducible protein A
MSLVATAARLLVELASEAYHEVRRRRRAEAKAREWAERPAAGLRACWNCGELVYGPAEGTVCGRCGVSQHQGQK